MSVATENIKDLKDIKEYMKLVVESVKYMRV